jgi:hypothetical protein
MPSPAQARSCGEHFPGNWFSPTPNGSAVLQVSSAIRARRMEQNASANDRTTEDFDRPSRAARPRTFVRDRPRTATRTFGIEPTVG